MAYLGEVLTVQQYIRDMTGHSIHKDTIKEALEKAERFRSQEREREKSDL